MTLAELIARFRFMARDMQEPFLWPDELVRDWLNEGQEQACIRARLIREDADAAICHVALTPGQSVYEYHPLVYELIHAQIRPASGQPRRLCLLSRELLDAEHQGWRESDRQAWALIQDDTKLRLAGKIEAGDVLELDCYRLPIRPMVDPDDEPEIHRAHHIHLVQWALFQAFSVVDAETLDAQRAQMAQELFTRYFGLQTDADMRRITREDVRHHARADFVDW